MAQETAEPSGAQKVAAMKINKYHGKYNISTRTMLIKYIVVHYTGDGTSKAGSAKNNCIYFGRANRDASAHYFIDDGGIWEYADPKKYYTWHCGVKYGGGNPDIGNGNSIGIEVCMDGDRPFTEAEIRYLTELVRYLMSKFDIPASRVVRHWDASHKMCPYYYAKRQKEWIALRKTITGTSSVASKARTYSGTFPVLPAKGYLRQGDEGTQVKRLQQFLNWYGGYGLAIDGSFGIATKTALKAFQKSNGLVADGHFGPASLKAAKAVKK